MKKLIVLLVLAGFISCNSNPANTEKVNAEGITRLEGKHFGSIISEKDAITFDELTQKMQTAEKVEAKVVGRVESVCQAKGCWMNIVSDQATNEQAMFVKFKDYGFFMPKDIAGKKVIMDGYAFKELTSVDELRHYAEDEGKSKEEIEAIVEPKEELKFLASGVILMQE